MANSYTTRKRILKQATGDNINLWGDLQSAGDFDLLDFALDGWTTKTLTTDYTLTTADGTTTGNEASARLLKFNGTGSYTVTIPSREAWYFVWNNLSGTLTVTTGAGTTAVLQTGERLPVMCDASNVNRLTLLSIGAQLHNVTDPTSAQDAATKAYVDATAFTMAGGGLPGQIGNAGKFLTTDGSNASWANVFASPTITTPTITAPTITGGATLSGGLTFSGSTKSTVNALAANDFDWSAQEHHTKSISTDTTFTFSGITASKAQALIVLLTISSAAVPTWPAAVKWANGQKPTLGNGTHLLGLVTLDGGTTVTGLLGARAQA